MKSLPITKEFTSQYIKDLGGFVSSVVSSARKYNPTFFESMSAFKDSISVLSKQLRKNKRLSKKLNISGFLLPVNNALAKRDRNNFYIYVGGVIELKNGVLSSQSICFSLIYDVIENIEKHKALIYGCPEYDIGKHVIRKFHFDIDRDPSGSPRPLSHLQYGGSFKSEHFKVCSTKDDLTYQLFSNLDDPRLPGIPYGLATCLDIIFRSFETGASEMSKERWWKEKVIESERHWLIPFFRSAVDSLSSASGETFYDFMLEKSAD